MPARDLFQVAPPKGGTDPDFNALVSQMNRYFLSIAQRLGALEGLGGQTVTFSGDLNLGKRRVRGVGPAQVEGDAMSRGVTAQQGALSRATGERVVVAEVIDATAGMVTPEAIYAGDAPAFEQIQDDGSLKVFTGGIRVGGSGVIISSIRGTTASLNFGPITGDSTSDLVIAVTGAVDGNTVALGVPIAALATSTTYSAFVSAVDTVTVRAAVHGATSRDPGAGTFSVLVFQ